jgi:hypothetical protein
VKQEGKDDGLEAMDDAFVRGDIDFWARGRILFKRE